MKDLSRRVRNIAPSLTVEIDTLAKKLKADGKDIVSLGAGEPDFDTPEEIREAGKASIDEGKTRYTSPQGILEVREAVAKKLLDQNGLRYSPDQIVMTSGAKHAVFDSLLALLDPGDEVIIPEPYWVTYPELVKLLGGTPVFVHTEPSRHFQMSGSDLRKKITPRTKAIILNNPTNPTGTLYAEDVLDSIAEAIVENDLYAVSDEVYEHFAYEGKFKSLAACRKMLDRTILINGLSKSHCMTGWRAGFIAAPEPIARLIAKAQGQTTHHPSNIAQYAAKKALEMPLDSVRKMRDEFRKRRDYVFREISAIPGVHADLPNGAFYLFASVGELFGKKTPEGKRIENSVEFCTYLLEETGLAIVPGSAFGREGYVRLSYAASMETLEKAVQRLKRAVFALH